MKNRATLNISLDVECPHCGDDVDLMDSRLGLNDDGGILNRACPNGVWAEEHENFQQDLHCPECGKHFIAEEIIW